MLVDQCLERGLKPGDPQVYEILENRTHDSVPVPEEMVNLRWMHE